MKVFIANSARKPVPETVIEVRMPAGDGAYTVCNILRQLQFMGNFGSSREIEIKDWAAEGESDTKKYKLRSKFGFDGDGQDKISSITVDGKPFEPTR